MIFTSPPGGVRSIVMSVSVCLSVRSRISKNTEPIFTSFFSVRVDCGRGSVLLRRRCFMLCLLPVLLSMNLMSCFHSVGSTVAVRTAVRVRRRLAMRSFARFLWTLVITARLLVLLLSRVVAHYTVGLCVCLYVQLLWQNV